MSETLLIAIFGVIAVATGSMFWALFNHIKECRGRLETMAELRGLATAIKEELTAMRHWRDVAFPDRMDKIMSDFHSDLDGMKRDIERLRDKA